MVKMVNEHAMQSSMGVAGNATNTVQLLTKLRSGSLLVTDHVRTLLTRIEEKNPMINAFLHVASEQALAQARHLDQKRLQHGPDALGKLFGLCLGIKSNIAVRGLPLTCGSKTLEKFIAPYDADVIAALRRQDAIILGMLNMDEFACGSSGESSAFGPAKNPAAPGRIPGGSSSGSAAAIAAGLCDAALGSDTGGSVRNPASHCGVVGIKPSYGRVSRYGLVDLAMTLDQIGTLCTDVQGAALILEVISGRSGNDARTLSQEVPTLVARTQAQQEAQAAPNLKLRIGIAPELQRLCTDMRIRKAIEDAAETLAQYFGTGLSHVHLPHVHLSIQTYYPLVYVEFFSGTRKFDGRKYGKRIEDAAGAEVLRRIAGGKEICKAEHHGRHYRSALAAKHLIKREIEEAFTGVDVLISPVTPMLPHRLGEHISFEQMYAYDAFTIPANLSECCAASVPITKIEGIPIGLHLMCKPLDEEKLVAAMIAWEKLREPQGP